VVESLQDKVTKELCSHYRQGHAVFSIHACIQADSGVSQPTPFSSVGTGHRAADS
jgi:hypothetical protein